MEDTFYALAILIIVGAVAAHSFIWTWLRVRKEGLFKREEERFEELDRRIAYLGRENDALALEVERLGELTHAAIRRGQEESPRASLPDSL